MSRFRLVKPRVSGKDDLIKVVWCEHQFRDGTWGEWASVEVRIRRKDWLNEETKVEINWSCVGAVDIQEAEAFAKGMAKAVAVAKTEEKKLLNNIKHVLKALDKAR